MDFVCLSGLPRTGSTLLSSILSQNPEIHAEGQSAVCQIMWDMEQTFQTKLCETTIKATSRKNTQNDLISSVPKIYYNNISSKTIVDKSRSWTFPGNVNLIKKYIREDPKIIVMVRPLEEILESFSQLRKKAGYSSDISDMLIPDSEPILWPLKGVQYAQQNNEGEYLFVEYKDLVDNTKEVLDRIYSFCEWEPFDHWFTNIKNPHPEDDSVWDFPGLHDIRPEISRRVYDS